MATQKKHFHVVHPIRHDGKGYNRGEKIATEKFEDKESARLLKAGVLSTTPVEVETDDATTETGE
jgi:hypothetical protein